MKCNSQFEGQTWNMFLPVGCFWEREKLLGDESSSAAVTENLWKKPRPLAKFSSVNVYKYINYWHFFMSINLTVICNWLTHRCIKVLCAWMRWKRPWPNINEMGWKWERSSEKPRPLWCHLSVSTGLNRHSSTLLVQGAQLQIRIHSIHGPK